MKKTFHLSPGDEGASEDVRRELELHLELRAREFEAQGMSPDAARRAALDAFGDRAAIEDEVKAIRESTVRERRSRDWIGELRPDPAVGVRAFARAPWFTSVAV